MKASITSFRKIDPTEITIPFETSDPAMTSYIRDQLADDVARHLAIVYGLLVDDRIIEIVTVSAGSVARAEISNSSLKREKLNQRSYPELPATLIGRLAVRLDSAAKGYGRLLLTYVLELIRKQASVVAVAYVIVDPKNARVASMYSRINFVPLRSSERMFLAVASIPMPEP